MKFGLMFFAASEDSLGADKYRLIVESARFADRAGFSSIWVPERHFTSFGGLYPNPAVLHAALAMCTSTLRLNAGSVVAPLHHPARIAEEWSVVDNLSNGRVGISFASGWNPDDFLFFPERYASRNDHLLESMRAVQALWRGEPWAGTSGAGLPCAVTIFPRPVQRELPVWMTVAGNPKNFERAGASGANLLTHLLDQDEEVLASRIALYRRARAAAGFDPSTGDVSLMIHTLVGAEAGVVREQARRPYCEYIKANIGLFKGLAQSRGRDADLSSMAPADLDEFVNFLYDRFAASRGLIGTPESCAALVSRLERAGVTELACLLDFGPDRTLILETLPHLARLKDLEPAQAAPAPAPVRAAAPRFDPAPVRRRCAREMSGDEFHARLGRRGIQIGGPFQPAGTTFWRRDGEALARMTLGPGAPEYRVHPASLDACCRTLAAALPGLEGGDGSIYLPAGFGTCDLRGPLTGTVWVHAVVSRTPAAAATSFSGDVRVYDETGRPLAAIGGIRLTSFERRTAPIDASSLLYERVWQASPSTPSSGGVRGRWALIAGDAALGAELARLLVNNGAECTSRADDPSLRGIVYLRALDISMEPDAGAGAVERAVEQSMRGALDVVQASGSTPVWIVTRSAVPGLEPDKGARRTTPNLVQAPLWGLGRALAVERPGALGALVDLDPATPADQAARQLLDVLAGSRDEDMIAFRGGLRYVPRLRRASGWEPGPEGPGVRANTTATRVVFDEHDTVLITGGTGGLGLRLAAWLASRGARHLIVCGRRAPGAPALEQLKPLRASGVRVVIMIADVGDEVEFSQQLAIATHGRPGVTSVFHLAGSLDDGLIEGQTWERFAAVLRAKVQGAWNLHRQTCGAGLRHFVMFSSAASMMPAPGQSSYAAANAFLDALAAYRRAQGLPALTVNWGPWSEIGHASTDYGRLAHERLATLGIGSIAPDEGLQVLEALMQQDRTQAVAVSVDWPQLFRADPGAARLGFLAAAAGERAIASADRSRAPSELVDRLRALPAEERQPYVLAYLSDMVIAALKLRTDEPLDPRQRLFDIGLDSIVALELKDRLGRAVGVKLSATLLFVRPTLESLADYLLTEVAGDPSGPADVPAPAAIATLSEEELTQMLLREIDVSRGA